MKNLKYSLYLLLLLLGITACQDQLDINRDPDSLSPEQIPLNSEFVGAVSGVAASTGSYYAIVGGFWSQYFTQSATANQYKDIDNYSINTSDLNGAWSSMYDAILDLRNVKDNAQKKENWNYYLMSSVMEAYAFQVLTDTYGPVPYKEATNASILNPKYDQESVIYDGLVASLKDALSKDLSKSSTDVIPGKDDLVFGGDMSKWTSFANTLLLKLYLRQTNSRPTVAENGIKELYAKGATFLNTNAAITQYINEANRSNPLYESDRRQLNVATNLRASTTLYSFLQSNSDPRFASFYNSGNSQNQGDFENSSNAGAAVIKLTATDPVYFISAAESYFLQSEASLRYNVANAKTLYENGVSAAFSQWGFTATTLLNGGYAYPNTDFNSNLKAIITQKWISFFPGKGYEGFYEQKRTGFPKVSSVAQTSPSYVSGEFSYSVNGTTNGVFPKRMVYPVTESQTNSNFPGLKAITEKLWYDAN